MVQEKRKSKRNWGSRNEVTVSQSCCLTMVSTGAAQAEFVSFHHGHMRGPVTPGVRPGRFLGGRASRDYLGLASGRGILRNRSQRLETVRAGRVPPPHFSAG